MFQTLILNHQYRPHDILAWKDAVTLMFKGKLEVLVQYDEFLAHIDRQTLNTFPALKKALRQVIGTDTESLEIKVPAVALLRSKVSRIKTGIKYSPFNVALRDGFQCKYCGERLPMSQLTRDHVIPRIQGGKTNWTNIVTACYECNNRKGGRTPQEAGMTLLSVPTKPTTLPLNGPYIQPDRAPEEWQPFLNVA